MAFCKYCGSQLEEGQECTCEGAQAAKNAAANPQPQATTAQAAPQVAAPAGPNVATQMVEVCKKFFTSPVELLEEAYTATSQVAQFVIAGIFALVSLLFVFLFFKDAYVDSPFVVALGITVALLLVKVAYAVVAFICKNTEGGFLNSLGLFAITTIPGVVVMLLTFLFDKMGFVVGAFSVLLFWIVADSVYSYLAFKTVIKNTKVKALYIFFICAFVVTLVLVAIGYNKVVDLASEMIQNYLMNSFNSLW